jgi:hypothetical protein
MLPFPPGIYIIGKPRMIAIPWDAIWVRVLIAYHGCGWVALWVRVLIAYHGMLFGLGF